VARLRLALVQKASSLDAAENRAALDAVAEALDPGTGLVLLPEAFMRDFGAPDTDLASTAEPLDGPFVQRLTAFAADRDTTVVAGMFEASDDPARPWNTLVVVDRDGLRASYRKIHLYDSFGYKESDRLLAGPTEPVLVDGKRGANIYVLPSVAPGADKILRDAIVYLTCLHESGHALGLSHTRAFADIMYSFQYGGDISAYFGRYRALLKTRADIAAHSGISDADRVAFRSAISRSALPF